MDKQSSKLIKDIFYNLQLLLSSMTVGGSFASSTKQDKLKVLFNIFAKSRFLKMSSLLQLRQASTSIIGHLLHYSKFLFLYLLYIKAFVDSILTLQTHFEYNLIVSIRNAFVKSICHLQKPLF